MTQLLIKNQAQNLPLDLARVPNHIAIIPDGNRRWARARSLFAEKGHKAGINLILEIVKAAKSLNVKVLTFFLFSTENWKRSQKEILSLRWLFKRFLKEKSAEMKRHGIRLRTIGNLKVFSEELQKILRDAVHETEQCNEIEMVLALNYGSHDEIQRALLAMIDDCEAKKIEKSQINEGLISSYLDTSTWKEPDLLIRSGGEKRMSNFLLWQLAYTEIYFTDRLWPDFTPDDLLEAIKDFQQRKRRWGGT